MATNFLLALKRLKPTSKGDVKVALSRIRNHAAGAMAFEADVLPSTHQSTTRPKMTKAGLK